jgi:WD40 repeat protein
LIKELLSDEEEKDGATTVAFSPNGRHLVTATAQDYLFWEIGSWSLARRIQEQPSQDFVPMIAFSRDGRILAGTYAMNKVRLHDAVTGEVLADLEAPNSRTITGLAFNHDGTQLAVAESQDALRLWDLRQIRRQLSKLGLDWSQPPYPAEDPAPAAHADGIAARAPTFSGTVLSEE